MNQLIIFTILCLVFSGCTNRSLKQNFTAKIIALEQQSNCTIGISASYIEKNQHLGYRESERFVMASTVKVPIAIYLMHKAEANNLLLNKILMVNPQDLSPGSGYLGYFVSRPGFAISIYNLLEPMLAISDNSATDVILKEISGTKAVFNFMQEKGFKDVLIDRTMLQLYIDTNDLKYIPEDKNLTLTKWRKLFTVKSPRMLSIYHRFDQDARDTITPLDMTRLLVALNNATIINQQNSAILIDILTRANIAPNRIRKALPKGFILANKSGSWWNSDQAAKKFTYTNDVGIITLPEHKGHIALSIYVRSSNIKVNTKIQESVIARAAKIIIDEFY